MREPMSCRCCDGEGVVWYDAADSRGEHETREHECPRCGGNGREPGGYDDPDRKWDARMNGDLLPEVR